VQVAPPEVDRDAEPPARARLRGFLRDAHGNPISGLALELRRAQGGGPAVRISGAPDGYFALESVPAGELVLSSPSAPGLLVGGIVVGAGEEKQLEVVLDWGEHRIEGQVTDPDGRPVSGARVVVAWLHSRGQLRSTSTRSATTDPGGEFEIADLGPGRHRLEVSASGYRTVRIPHEVGRGPEQIEVRLRPVPSTL
jgi:hypothetical protein